MKIPFPVKIYFVALVLRLIPVLLTMNLGIGLDDMFQYDMLARSLAVGNGFRWYAQDDLKLLEPYVDFDLSTATGYDPKYGLYTSFRAPLYPAFLALVYSISGLEFSRFFAARLAQVILLGAPLAPLTYLTARQFFGNEDDLAEKSARLSAWIVACYPMLLVYPLGLGTENLFFVLLLCSVLFLLRSLEDSSALNLLLSGFFLALTALTRSLFCLLSGWLSCTSCIFIDPGLYWLPSLLPC
ncbi:MAG: glycosyltransferase family 39 protein [Anaerolineales bacterium]|nr:glycosyltransferase family 39 protein [Anaerolineales bacterium]